MVLVLVTGVHVAPFSNPPPQSHPSPRPCCLHSRSLLDYCPACHHYDYYYSHVPLLSHTLPSLLPPTPTPTTTTSYHYHAPLPRPTTTPHYHAPLPHPTTTPHYHTPRLTTPLALPLPRRPPLHALCPTCSAYDAPHPPYLSPLPSAHRWVFLHAPCMRAPLALWSVVPRRGVCWVPGRHAIGMPIPCWLRAHLCVRQCSACGVRSCGQVCCAVPCMHVCVGRKGRAVHALHWVRGTALTVLLGVLFLLLTFLCSSLLRAWVRGTALTVLLGVLFLLLLTFLCSSLLRAWVRDTASTVLVGVLFFSFFSLLFSALLSYARGLGTRRPLSL